MPSFLVFLATDNSDFSGGVFRATLEVLATSPPAASLPVTGPECTYTVPVNCFRRTRYCLVSQERLDTQGRHQARVTWLPLPACLSSNPSPSTKPPLKACLEI